jgi:competence protein ComEA
MRSRRSHDSAWSEAAARRLAQLTADLGGTPPDPRSANDPDGPTQPRDDWWADHTRVVVAPDRDEPPAPPEPVVLPQPGRHAARRRRSFGWRPPTAGLPALGAAQVAVVAVLALVGLGATAWWVAREHARPVQTVPVSEASPLFPQAASTPPGASPTMPPTATSTATGGAQVTVDVTGKVRRPGIVVLDAGARVVDAVKAAGGARPGTDLASLNLARLLVDGEQIVVGQPGAAPPAADSAVPGGSASASGPTTLVNLNLATESELESLPEVGPVTAQAILAWRDQHGGFTSVDELLEVDGIGPATLDQVKPYVTV